MSSTIGLFGTSVLHKTVNEPQFME